MNLRRAILAYCLFAVCAVVGLLVWTARAASILQAAGRAAAERASAASCAVELLNKTILDLMQEQRETRLTASPAEAIELSARLQALQGQFDEAAKAHRTASSEAARLESEHRRTLVRLVPLIALLLLHVVGLYYFANGKQTAGIRTVRKRRSPP